MKAVRFLLTLLFLFFIVPNRLVVQSSVKVTSSTFGTMQARNIGPAIMSGRVTSIDALQTDPRLVYIGTASGGLWKSTNGGVKTKPVFDKHTMSIGAVCIDQDRPDTVWVGTGESWTRNSVSVGTGVYKCTDGGDIWKLMGLENTERISKIMIHPENPDIVFVAALGHLWGPNEERGLYKTTDGGQTWNKLLYVDENTGCSDFDIDPGNPDIIYAGMWQFRRTAWDFYSGGTGSGLYKTTNGGLTWSEITSDLPQGKKGRIAVCVSQPDNNQVFTLIESDKTALYKSTDKGESWEMINNTPTIRERPFYFALLVPDPVDTNKLYKPGKNLSVSQDGGKKFRNMGGAIHLDFHALWISEKDHNFMYAGTDGGAYSSNDMGGSWQHMRNLPVAQFYHISADMQKPYNVYGGLQDNGQWMGPSRAPGGIRNSHWNEVNGMSDGFSVIPDKVNNNIVYWQMQGGIFAQTDLNNRSVKFVAPIENETTGKLRFNWDAAISMSPTSNRVYVGAQYLFKSEDRGVTWEKISPDLTTNDAAKQQQAESGGLTVDNSTAENHTTIICISESAIDEDLIWVGTDDGNLQVTLDGGGHWENTSGNIPGLPANTWCSSVYPSRFDKGTAYTTFDGHRNDDKKPYVFQTTDYGNTWTSLATDDITAYCYKIIEDPVNPDLLFLGTEFGLFISLDAGSSWAQFKGELPNVSVMDMVIHPRENDLILGTHGRGVYIIDDISPLRQLTSEILDSDFAFLDSRAAVPMNVSGPQWPGLGDEFVGNNPTTAIPITFYMKKRHIFGKMSIEIFDRNDKRISELANVSRKGVNRAYWMPTMKPARTPKTDAIPFQMMFAFGGPEYLPGIFKVRVTKGKDVFESDIEIHKNPDHPYTQEDLDIRMKTVMKGYGLMEDLAYTDRRINDVLEITDPLEDSPEFKSSAKKKITVMNSELESIKDRMMVRKYGDVRGDSELREDLGFLYGTVRMFPGRPTNSQIRRMDELALKVEDMEKDVDNVFGKYLEGINTQLEKTGLDAIKVTTREEFDAEK
ncbi:MAG TPA: glycosyl hydrolase [Bacteroides sp.]|nr:glycosyl hydrolase [Bacteroides sp.]